jgi:hypothetical protein
MARKLPLREEPRWLAWGNGPTSGPALLLIGLFGFLLALVAFGTGGLLIVFLGIGTQNFWIGVVGLFLTMSAALLHISIRSRGARVVAYRGGEEIQTEGGPSPPTSWERTTRR